jgi:hypothetical protein
MASTESAVRDAIHQLGDAVAYQQQQITGTRPYVEQFPEVMYDETTNAPGRMLMVDLTKAVKFRVLLERDPEQNIWTAFWDTYKPYVGELPFEGQASSQRRADVVDAALDAHRDVLPRADELTVRRSFHAPNAGTPRSRGRSDSVPERLQRYANKLRLPLRIEERRDPAVRSRYFAVTPEGKDFAAWRTEKEGRVELDRMERMYGESLRQSFGPSYRSNTHHSLSGGLHDDPELLQQFVEMAAESMDDPDIDREAVEVTNEVYDVAKEYDAALASTLDLVVRGFPPGQGATADDLWNTEGPYLVLMTLRGEGVNIHDEWDRFFTSSALDRVAQFLEERLGRFADISGAGLLNEAFYNAAYETGRGEAHEPNTALGPQWSPRPRRTRTP